jgi:hypothetical protein
MADVISDEQAFGATVGESDDSGRTVGDSRREVREARCKRNIAERGYCLHCMPAMCPNCNQYECECGL